MAGINGLNSFTYCYNKNIPKQSGGVNKQPEINNDNINQLDCVVIQNKNEQSEESVCKNLSLYHLDGGFVAVKKDVEFTVHGYFGNLAGTAISAKIDPLDDTPLCAEIEPLDDIPLCAEIEPLDDIPLCAEIEPLEETPSESNGGEARTRDIDEGEARTRDIEQPDEGEARSRNIEQADEGESD